MKFNKTFKRAMSVVLATAVVMGSVVSTGTQASAKAKSYTARMLFAGKGWQWMANDTTAKVETTVKNKKGKSHYTLTLKKANAVPANRKKNVTAAHVFVVDVQDILKDYSVKKLKYSNVVVKCDGKVVKINAKKLKQGAFEPKLNKNYRLSIYNAVGSDGDTTAKSPCAKPTAFKWKKSISISFDFTIK